MESVISDLVVFCMKGLGKQNSSIPCYTLQPNIISDSEQNLFFQLTANSPDSDILRMLHFSKAAVSYAAIIFSRILVLNAKIVQNCSISSVLALRLVVLIQYGLSDLYLRLFIILQILGHRMLLLLPVEAENGTSCTVSMRDSLLSLK